jgi:hypothetical protein
VGLQAVVLLSLVVLLAFRFINAAVARLGLQAVVLLSLVVLLAFQFINAVVQGWDCRQWCC